MFSKFNKSALASTEVPWVGIRLEGGLGNQLFQFALGLTLANSNNSMLKIDVSKLHSYGTREIELEPLLTSNEIVTNEPKIKNSLKEKGFAFQQEFLNSPVFTWQEGYFQSWKYFQSIEVEIKKRLLGKEDIQSQNKSIGLPESFIALQVRRGDYLNPEQIKFHGICGLDYYKFALELARKVVGDLPAVVFSDDQDAAEFFASQLPNSQPDKPIIGETALETLRRLTAGKSHIIANSSFGWWGSWLSESSQLTIAPRPWFNDASINTRDLLPPQWITVDKQ